MSTNLQPQQKPSSPSSAARTLLLLLLCTYTYAHIQWVAHVCFTIYLLCPTNPSPPPTCLLPVTLAPPPHRYRKWQLSDSLSIVVRCEVDGISSIKGQDQLLLIKTLNEYDSRASGLDWRQKLDQQRGAVLATELKNNAAKVARWTAQALLASADIIRLGFVSRVSSRDNKAHVVLGAAAVKPREFAQQISLSMDNCWGIVRAIVDLIMLQEDGKFLLVKVCGHAVCFRLVLGKGRGKGGRL